MPKIDIADTSASGPRGQFDDDREPDRHPRLEALYPWRGRPMIIGACEPCGTDIPVPFPASREAQQKLVSAIVNFCSRCGRQVFVCEDCAARTASYAAHSAEFRCGVVRPVARSESTASAVAIVDSEVVCGAVIHRCNDCWGEPAPVVSLADAQARCLRCCASGESVNAVVPLSTVAVADDRDSERSYVATILAMTPLQHVSLARSTAVEPDDFRDRRLGLIVHLAGVVVDRHFAAVAVAEADAELFGGSGAQPVLPRFDMVSAIWQLAPCEVPKSERLGFVSFLIDLAAQGGGDLGALRLYALEIVERGSRRMGAGTGARHDCVDLQD